MLIIKSAAELFRDIEEIAFSARYVMFIKAAGYVHQQQYHIISCRLISSGVSQGLADIGIASVRFMHHAYDCVVIGLFF